MWSGPCGAVPLDRGRRPRRLLFLRRGITRRPYSAILPSGGLTPRSYRAATIREPVYAGTGTGAWAGLFLSNRVTVSDGCAPLFIQ